ncbi:hypothetical protein [Paenibacillus sp. J2TS4]|uniref:hypothetical protein n=1 Tax=Paenibacillus sp. J2TS4 TaxID=2807194 RepID=UPI001AFE90C6|nr:hypothetical protein [Paenibacillus sp. J2TS4]GIP35035.1 hypothetical protein J2TS4_42450 [Paenibacillus sp. J2TS4]
MKRYLLQKLCSLDSQRETWTTIMESNNKEALLNFLGWNYRIVDRSNQEEVARSDTYQAASNERVI